MDYNLVKTCNKCGVIQLKMNFHKAKNNKDGLHTHCRICRKIIRKKYYDENRERELQNSKKYSDENHERQLENIKKYYNENRDLRLIQIKKYNQEHRDEINIYLKNRRDTNTQYRLACNLRSRTYQAFKSQNIRKTNKTFDLLGCSHSFFKKWIEFRLYGNMTLENYGNVWENDHCLPINSFNLFNENEMKKCFNWKNLRPMSAKENISKKAKVDQRLYLTSGN